MDYPRHYEGCPLLSVEVIHHFLKSCDSWFSRGQHNIVLMHCEVGCWPVLAFMSAALLLYRKHYTAANSALDMVYKQAPPDVSPQLMSPLNSLASQLRYLQYVLKRKAEEQWPPADKPLTLVCVMMRMIPDFDGKGGCCPIFRIYGRNPLLHVDKSSKLLFSTPRRNTNVRSYNQVTIGKNVRLFVISVGDRVHLCLVCTSSDLCYALLAESEVVKIDINCHIQGDVVLECLNLHDDMAKADIMYFAMFNIAFIKSNTLVLNRNEIDVSWGIKDQFSKDFKAELFFSEVDTTASMVLVDLSCFEEEGLLVEAFGRVQEMFSSLDWLVPLPASSANGKIQLIDHRRAYNCEILLLMVKTPVPELMEYVLNLDDSAMDVDQVENLIKCCPTREEMELLKGYQGEPENLGKCEQIFLELMKVPRPEAKLIIYAYKLQFSTQVSELRDKISIVYLSVEQASFNLKYKDLKAVELMQILERWNPKVLWKTNCNIQLWIPKRMLKKGVARQGRYWYVF
ncbi:unnamed protein product [Lactuca virosa]|uniref:Formin-like protein n=1 Tax=Lactuca virosa TaxID=75947 RepID=A0AAU9MXG3_9ASTR|nr:unnamed protein product [Lactuca virosa]